MSEAWQERVEHQNLLALPKKVTVPIPTDNLFLIDHGSYYGDQNQRRGSSG